MGSGAAGDSVAAEPDAISGRAMGTQWTVKWVPSGAKAVSPEELRRAIGDQLEPLEQAFSTYREGSEVMRFNASATAGWVPVSAELAQVVADSQEISVLTGGAFDVTVHPLVVLWGFGPIRRAGSLPTNEAIALARGRVDWRALEVRRDAPALRRMRAGVALDPSSMAKGFAADEVSAALASRGLPNHLVQIAGDLRTRGPGPDGAGWAVAVEEPASGRPGVATRLRLSDRSLSTSGSYRNYFELGGRRYGHLIDPRTGRPAEHALAAVSVVHPSCAKSSAWATALFVLGPDEGFQRAVDLGLAAVFFLASGERIEARFTPAWERQFP